MSPFTSMTAREKKWVSGDASACAVLRSPSSSSGTFGTSYAGLYGTAYMMPWTLNNGLLKRKRLHHAKGILYLYGP